MFTHTNSFSSIAQAEEALRRAFAMLESAIALPAESPERGYALVVLVGLFVTDTLCINLRQMVCFCHTSEEEAAKLTLPVERAALDILKATSVRRSEGKCTVRYRRLLVPVTQVANLYWHQCFD